MDNNLKINLFAMGRQFNDTHINDQQSDFEPDLDFIYNIGC